MRFQEQSLPISVSPFDEIAAEYYDPSLHPTCANFRVASSLRLKEWLKDYDYGHLYEVGCGKSLAAEILAASNLSLRNVTLTDDSAAMLEYSRSWAALGAQLKAASAYDLPAPSGSLRYLISCLGDPYNNSAFWQEVARVLEPGGCAFYSTPSYDWAHAFRERTTPDEAEFELADGRHVMIPSYIYPQRDQIHLIEGVGLRVEAVSNVTIHDLNGQSLSPKLLAQRGSEAIVVTCFTGIKP